MRRFACICLIAIAAVAAVLGTTGRAEAKRVALVVGIDKYEHLESDQQLRKAVNDARAIAGAFKGMGYEVAKAENVGRLDFLRNWSIFLNGIEPGDEVAFFFAGHGIEIARQNFLLPGDAPVVKPGEEQVMRASAIAMGELLDQLRERQPRVSLTIIDACRDNPFTDGRGRSIGATRGLARIDPPRGSFVMLSAAAGETSLDRLGDGDKNPNSIYTRSLLPRLKEQGATIVEIARLVRQDVVEIARKHAHVQTPAYFDELVGDFCPAGCETATAEQSAPAPQSAPEPVAPQPAPAPAAAPAPAPQPAPVAPPKPAPEPAQPEQKEQEVAAVDPAPASPEPQKIAPGPSGPTRVLQEEGLFWSVAFSPDGKRLAAGTHEKRVVVFDLATSSVLHRLEGHSELVMGVAFSPDGRLIASASDDKTIRIWDAATGAHVRTLVGHEHWVRELAFSPDGALLASGGADKTVRLWDVKTGALLRKLEGHANHIQAVMFHPGPNLLISVDAVGSARVHDLATGELINDFDLGEDELRSAALSRDGGLFVTGHFTKKLKLWDGKPKLVRERTDLPGEVEDLAISPADDLIASLSKNRIQLWTPDLEPRADWTESLVTDIAFSPDGNTIAAVGGDVWLVNLAEKIAGFTPKAAAEPDQNQQKLAAVDPAPALAPPAPAPAGPARILKEEALFYSVAFSPDGTQLAAGTHETRVVVFDLATSQVLYRLEGHTELIRDVVFSPDSRLIASASNDKTVKLWDALTGKLVRTLTGNDEWVMRVAFSPDGAMVASGGADKTLRLWDVKSGKQLHRLTGHSNMIEGVMFAPEGILISADAVDDVRVHDATTGKLVREVDIAEHTLSSVALSPEGKLLATGHFTKKLKLWDSQFNLVGERTDFPDDVEALAFSPTQPLIASVCDNKIQLWTPELDKPRAEWAEYLVNDVEFSPDGNTIAAVGGEVWLYSVADKIAGR